MNEFIVSFEIYNIIAFGLLPISVLFLLYILSRVRRDINKLKVGVHSLLREKPTPSKLNFSSSTTEDIWRSCVTLSLREKKLTDSTASMNEILNLGSKIAGAADHVSSVAEIVSKNLYDLTQPDTIAVAIVLRDPNSGQLYLEHLLGIPSARIRHSLLMHFDKIFEAAPSAGISWGYHNSSNYDFINLTAFKIGSMLTVPLRNTLGICGGIWIGMSEGTMSLSVERKTFIHAISNYAAASFYAAMKSNEQTEKISSEKDFLLGLSHDLRSPGNTALYAIKDLISGELGTLTPEQHLRLSLIDSALQDQLSIIGDVLDYTKHQKGFLQADKEDVQLKPIINQSLEKFCLNIEKKGLYIHCDKIPDVDIHVDPKQLKRILANFLSNAVAYTETGGIYIRFLTHEAHLEVLIEDTGIGVPKDEAAMLFKEFYRLKNAANAGEGFGLGLALVKALATLNNAYVSYRPNPKGGSIFLIGIPISNREKEQSISKNKILLDTIIVADDDHTTCRANIRYLKGVAQTLVPANTLIETTNLINSTKPQLIVTDLNLGDGSALSFIKNLSIPTVVITGSGYEPELDLIRKKRPNIITLEKPVSKEVLRNAVIKLSDNCPMGQ
jgi:signal transduction histidine kinase